MKILLISAAFPPDPGGVATHVTNLAHELLRINNENKVIVICSNKLGKTVYPSSESGRLQVWKLPVEQIESFSGRSVPLGTILKFALDNWEKFIDADIIHAHDCDSTLIGAQLKSVFNIPLFVTIHRAPINWRNGRAKENVKDCFVEFLNYYKIVERLIVPSKFSKKILTKQGIDSYKVKVINHGINHKYLASFQNMDFLQKILPTNDSKLILCPIRADEHKDPDTFVRAACLLKKRHNGTNLFFILTAESNSLYKFEKLAESLGLSVGVKKDILFRHFSFDEMPTLYRKAKVCVIPSMRESFGQTAIESFIFRTPVVAANNTALREIIKHKKNGLLFNTGSAEDLAENIERILFKRVDIEKIVNAAYKDTLKNYTSQMMTEKYMKLYKNPYLDSK